MAANACGKNQTGIYVAAASNTIWENRAACGKSFILTCIGATNLAPYPCQNIFTIVVEIVDYCPNCRETLNLSEDAFSEIANLDAGVIKIEYFKYIIS